MPVLRHRTRIDSEHEGLRSPFSHCQRIFGARQAAGENYKDTLKWLLHEAKKEGLAEKEPCRQPSFVDQTANVQADPDIYCLYLSAWGTIRKAIISLC